VKDDVLDRIQRALDAGASLDDDLEREFASDPDALRMASELVAIDEALRHWPEVSAGDELFDAIVTRIEQRLDEPLAPIGDPTAAPSFDDEEQIAISIAPVSMRASRDVLELRELGSPGRASAETLPPELLESIPPEAPADLPAPAPVLRLPINTNERFSLPSVRPQPMAAPFAKRTEPPKAPAAKQRGAPVLWIVGGTLAAAAAVLLAVAVGTFGATPAYEVADRSAPEAAEELAAVPMAPSPTTSPRAARAGGSGSEVPPAEIVTEEAAANGALFGQLADRAEPPEGQAGWDDADDARTVELEAPEDGLELREDHGQPARRAVSQRERNDPNSTVRGSGSTGAPTREQIVAAMRSVAGSVGACGGGARTGVAEVRVRLGSSGRVQSAIVTGQFAGTPEGSCIARAVRSARVPPFRQSTFEFTYPFRIQ
jgi:hypothetical protein